MKGADATPFASPEALAGAFEAGLEALLDAPQLGAYILVLANAAYAPAMLARFERRLSGRFDEFAAEIRGQLAAGRALDFPDDDLQVFLKLMALGLTRLAPREVRHAGGWEIQFNLLRAFRPQRANAETIRTLSRPFDPAAFHFNKPFLRKEIFWSGALGGRDVALLYNKYPFASYHGLLVPQGEREQPQFLTREHHAYLWGLCEALGASLPGVGFGYNALGAGASINHLHFQFYLRQEPLPIEQGGWLHNGGHEAYPLTCRRLDDMGGAWTAIESCHQANRPYNLLYRPGCCYLVERGWHGAVALPDWMSAITWFEAAGGVTCFNRDDFESLTPDAIGQALRRQR